MAVIDDSASRTNPSAARNSRLREPLVVQRNRQRRPRDRRHRIQHADAGAEDQRRRSLRLNRPPEAGRLQQDQRQQHDERVELQPVRADAATRSACPTMTPGTRPMIIGSTRRQTAGSAVAIHPQHVGVERHLDEDQRRVEHAVRQEQQRQRHGDRREPVPERAVDDGGEERDQAKRDRVWAASAADDPDSVAGGPAEAGHVHPQNPSCVRNRMTFSVGRVGVAPVERRPLERRVDLDGLIGYQLAPTVNDRRFATGRRRGEARIERGLIHREHRVAADELQRSPVSRGRIERDLEAG